MTPLAPLLALLVAGSAIATPLYPRQQANATTPTVANATASITPRTIVLDGGIPVTGYTNAQYNVSSFLGIPFATSERFRAPVLVDYAGNSTYARGINATAQGPACMQSPGLGRTLANGTYTKGGVSEDCLGVNVYGPASAGNATKLPVVVWCEYLAFFSSCHESVVQWLIGDGGLYGKRRGGLSLSNSDERGCTVQRRLCEYRKEQSTVYAEGSRTMHVRKHHTGSLKNGCRGLEVSDDMASSHRIKPLGGNRSIRTS